MRIRHLIPCPGGRYCRNHIVCPNCEGKRNACVVCGGRGEVIQVGESEWPAR